jgi:hypothetical protein
MAEMDPTESALEVAEGAAGPHATDAFGLLGNETRLAILLALWEEYDPYGDDDTTPFSRIFERVDYDDPGNLRYHLEKLAGEFIRQRAEGEGYELRQTGLRLVQTVIAGVGVGEATIEATEINQGCLRCDAPTVIGYRDGLLLWACTECEGVAPNVTDTDGLLSVLPFAPAALTKRTPEEIRAASIVSEWREKQLMFDGLCPTCSGPVSSWLEPCTEHEPAGVCEQCGTAFAVWARHQCEVCKAHGISSPKTLALFHPAVTSFYDDHGVSIRLQADDFDHTRRVFDHMHDHGMELVSTTPPIAVVTVCMNDEKIRLTFDETVNVVDVCR